MEGIKSYQDEAEELEKKELEEVREMLRRAADVKDSREMWLLVRDIFNLLTMMVAPTSRVPVEPREMMRG